MALRWLLRAVAGLAAAGVVVLLIGRDPVGLGFGGFAFVLVMATRTLTVVLVGIGLGVLFMSFEGLVVVLEEAFPDPRIAYGITFVVGVVFGKVEEKVFGEAFG